MAASAFQITARRSSVADPTTPYIHDNTVIVFRKGTVRATTDYWRFFLQPFHTLVYGVVAGCLVMVLLLLLLLERGHWTLADGQRRARLLGKELTVLWMAVEGFGILLAGLVSRRMCSGLPLNAYALSPSLSVCLCLSFSQSLCLCLCLCLSAVLSVCLSVSHLYICLCVSFSLDYCNSVLAGLCCGQTRSRLQRVWRRRRDQTTPLLNKLRWLPVAACGIPLRVQIAPFCVPLVR